MVWTGGKKLVGLEEQEGKRWALCRLTWPERRVAVVQDGGGSGWGGMPLEGWPWTPVEPISFNLISVSVKACLVWMGGSDWGRNRRKVTKKPFVKLKSLVSFTWRHLDKRREYLNLTVRFLVRDLGELCSEGGDPLREKEVSALGASLNALCLPPLPCRLSRWRESSVLSRNFVHVVRLLKKWNTVNCSCQIIIMACPDLKYSCDTVAAGPSVTSFCSCSAARSPRLLWVQWLAPASWLPDLLHFSSALAKER